MESRLPDPLYPGNEVVEPVPQELFSSSIGNRPICGDQSILVNEIYLRVSHEGDIQGSQDAAEVCLANRGPDTALTGTDNGCGFASPYVLAIRTRAPIDHVFQHTRYRPVIFWSGEQYRISSSDLAFHLGYGGW